MAVNKPVGDNARKGAVRKRPQLETKIMGEKHWSKRNKESGQFMDQKDVRHQRSLDRTGGLNKGEFLAHRNIHRSEDETANPTIEGTG